LEYRVYYSNTGTGPITDLRVNDVAPAYTEFVPGSGACHLTPTGMTCSPVTGISDIHWRFTGTLTGGSSGNVSYRVKVDD